MTRSLSRHENCATAHMLMECASERFYRKRRVEPPTHSAADSGIGSGDYSCPRSSLRRSTPKRVPSWVPTYSISASLPTVVIGALRC